MVLNNKTTLITGGNGGIGFATAKLFHQEGAKVAITGRNQETLQKAKKDISENLITYQFDIKNINDIETCYKDLHSKHGNFDVIVANAGIMGKGYTEDMTEEYYDEIVDINLKGIYFTVQKAFPYLNDGASIILVSSVSANGGVEGNGVYGMAKAGVQYLAKAFSAELVDRKIRVNAVSPGYTLTPIFEPLFAKDKTAHQQRADLIPVKHFADPTQIAECIAFLASDKASYIYGENINVDGGLTNIFKWRPSDRTTN